jgi:anhydro-N-acetylmuramic acid kinase
MTDLSRIAAKKRRLAIGLMSGTSADGVDAALVRIEGSGVDSTIEVVAWRTYPYPRSLREEVLSVSSGAKGSAGRLADLSFSLGRAFGEAALALCREAGVEIRRVDLIGSHGQTVTHRPPGGEREATVRYGAAAHARRSSDSPGCTMQLGEPCVIAEVTGTTTVADFRPRDMAAGGQGAPLVPLVDYILFRSARASRCALNLGGIANVTLLPKRCSLEDVSAFDTGPGNMVLDWLAKTFSAGERAFDEGGDLALRGKTDKRLIEKLLLHPYFSAAPPKSTGRETFGEKYAGEILAQGARLGLEESDIMMTAVALTARTAAGACRDHFRHRGRLDEVIVSGGGVHNRALKKSLTKSFKPARVIVSDDLGVPADAKEAVAFAMLANETISGNPGNVPSATGASRPVVLGKIVP